MNIISFNPFNFFARKLEAIFQKAKEDKSPAWYLFKNGARTQLFMLEALTKLYVKDTDDEMVKKWFKRFKDLEDSLGVIDYYDVFIQQFKRNRKVSKAVLGYCINKRDEEVSRLNKVLKNKGWLDGKLQHFEFAAMPVEYNNTHIGFLKMSLRESTEHIRGFVEKTGCHFTKLDAHVHTLRRKARWLSMYAMALNGLLQLKKSKKEYPWEKEYVTKAVISNPYNKVVKAPKGLPLIHYDQSVFYALSKLISDLAVIKDQGLKLELVIKAIEKTSKAGKKDAEKQAMEMLGKNQPTLQEVLDKASAMAKHFFTEQKILDNELVL